MYVFAVSHASYFNLFSLQSLWVCVRMCVCFNNIGWLKVLTRVLSFFFPPEVHDNGIISAESIQSHKQSHQAGACHPIIDSVIYEFPLYGAMKCFYLNHYWATWIIGINLPTRSAYNDRSSQGERVSVRREQLLSCPHPWLCRCMPE